METYPAPIIAAFERFPDRIAFAHNGVEINFSYCLQLMYKIAHQLRSLGYERGASLAFLTSNSPESYITKVAAQLLGCRTVGIDRVLATPEQQHILTDAGAATVVCDPTTFEDAHAVLSGSLRVALLILGPVPGEPDLLEQARSQPATPIQPEGRPTDAARLCYTGGSTGRSKGCSHTFETLGNHWALQPRRWSPRVAKFGKAAERYLVTSDPSVSSVANDYLTLALLNGGTAHLLDEFKPEQALRTIADKKITAVFLGTANLYRLLDAPELADTDTSSLRAITFASSPITSQRFTQAMAAFGTILSEAYGQTEAGLISVLAPEDLVGRQGELRLLSAGLPEPGVSVSVRGESGNTLAVGDIGAIWVRTGQAMDGYWGQDDLTGRTIVGDWLDTGDLGFLDIDGFLHLVDRVKDMVIVRGENCFSHGIEEQLAGHPAVRQAAVIGVPSALNGEEVHAVIVTHPGTSVTLAELKDLVTRALSPLHAPQSVDFVDELPHTPAGKVDKKALRAPFRDHANNSATTS